MISFHDFLEMAQAANILLVPFLGLVWSLSHRVTKIETKLDIMLPGKK